MKPVILLFLLLSLLGACKEDTTVVPDPIVEYPETWGMIGTLGSSDFTATSLNASLIYDSVSNNYDLNVMGWNKDSDETIYLHYGDFSFGESKNYLVMTTESYPPDGSFAWYEQVQGESQFGTGGIAIFSTTDTLVKGSYNFTTKNNVQIKGSFTIKALFSYK